MKQSDDLVNNAIPYMYKILQFCPEKESFNLLHVLNMTDLPGTLVSQGLKLLKEVHKLLTEQYQYATCIQQEFPRPTWYTLTDEGRRAQQAALHNPLPGSLDMFVEVHDSSADSGTALN